VIEPNDSEQRSNGRTRSTRGTYPQPIPESAQVKPRTDQTRVRQRAIERTVFPSVRVRVGITRNTVQKSDVSAGDSDDRHEENEGSVN
jgi:hypothetical protein